MKKSFLSALAGAIAFGLGVVPASATPIDLGTGSPIATGVSNIGTITFTPAPATGVFLVTGKNDMDVYFPNQNPDTVLGGVATIVGIAPSTLELVDNFESGFSEDFAETGLVPFQYVAVHQGKSELIFEYSTLQTSFTLDTPETLSNFRFYADPPPAPVPEPASFGVLCSALLGFGLTRRRHKG